MMDTSVCLSAQISPELHDQSSPIFLFIYPMAIAQSSSGGIAIHYVLPVLCMMPCLPILGSMAYFNTVAESDLLILSTCRNECVDCGGGGSLPAGDDEVRQRFLPRLTAGEC